MSKLQKSIKLLSRFYRNSDQDYTELYQWIENTFPKLIQDNFDDLRRGELPVAEQQFCVNFQTKIGTFNVEALLLRLLLEDLFKIKNKAFENIQFRNRVWMLRDQLRWKKELQEKKNQKNYVMRTITKDGKRYGYYVRIEEAKKENVLEERYKEKKIVMQSVDKSID